VHRATPRLLAIIEILVKFKHSATFSGGPPVVPEAASVYPDSLLFSQMGSRDFGRSGEVQDEQLFEDF
jgi:hypothetical protein